jgi:hypothetical protein
MSTLEFEGESVRAEKAKARTTGRARAAATAEQRLPMAVGSSEGQAASHMLVTTMLSEPSE